MIKALIPEETAMPIQLVILEETETKEYVVETVGRGIGMKEVPLVRPL
jgi:hypothetical protein